MHKQRVTNLVYLFSCIIFVIWLFGYFIDLDWPRWFDVATVVAFGLVFFIPMFEEYTKQCDYVCDLKIQRDQPCVHCGNNWHTSDESEANHVPTFRSRRGIKHV